MTMNSSIIIFLLAIAIILAILAVYIKISGKQEKEEKISNKKRFNFNDTEEIVDFLNTNEKIQKFGSKFTENNKLQKLFNKSGNPWKLNTFTYTAIRFGGLAIGIVLALIFFFIIGISGLIIFLMIGLACFVLPKKKYEDAAKERERQWTQLYQFMWVIKHNATFYDPKKVWIETGKYISEFTNNLPELEKGFADFADHWNESYMDDYIKETYGEFPIAKELFSIMLVSQQTGQFPEKELDSLREIIINKQDFYVNNELSTVGAKATLVSAPFLMGSMFVSIIVPVILMVLQAFS